MNQKLVEICLRVRDIDATLDFYTNLFDFEVASHRKFPENKFDLIYLNSPGSSVQPAFPNCVTIITQKTVVTLDI